MVVPGGCSNEENVLCSDPSLDAAVLRSNHKEADMRFVLPEVRHIDNVVVSARDKGVLYFSWRITLSSHQWCGHGQELQISQSTYLWRGSQQIFLVTRQVHCYNFTPSPAVTAPRSLTCGHSKKTAWTVFTEHFNLLSSVGEDVLDADTIASAEKFAWRMYKTSEDSFDLACVVLLGNISSPEKLPPTSDAFKQHLVLPNPEETDWTLAEDLLVLVFMTLDPIPKACLEMVSYRCTTGCATLGCKCRESRAVCTGLCGCTKTDANC